ncbi:hypothetical protein BU16DRAFT_391220 [Lophium mytilinum]|uniref:Uncharacterized protein n=1 Tax=Lophium mytilinum TaxID=390894 RepID=A0A6A6QUV2_9PEZI|nr:hypothetical protein BU16DRAFT_391220 [Lophium mytilinum]
MQPFNAVEMGLNKIRIMLNGAPLPKFDFFHSIFKSLHIGFREVRKGQKLLASVSSERSDGFLRKMKAERVVATEIFRDTIHGWSELSRMIEMGSFFEKTSQRNVWQLLRSSTSLRLNAYRRDLENAKYQMEKIILRRARARDPRTWIYDALQRPHFCIGRHIDEVQVILELLKQDLYKRASHHSSRNKVLQMIQLVKCAPLYRPMRQLNDTAIFSSFRITRLDDAEIEDQVRKARVSVEKHDRIFEESKRVFRRLQEQYEARGKRKHTRLVRASSEKSEPLPVRVRYRHSGPLSVRVCYRHSKPVLVHKPKSQRQRITKTSAASPVDPVKRGSDFTAIK